MFVRICEQFHGREGKLELFYRSILGHFRVWEVLAQCARTVQFDLEGIDIVRSHSAGNAERRCMRSLHVGSGPQTKSTDLVSGACSKSHDPTPADKPSNSTHVNLFNSGVGEEGTVEPPSADSF